MGKLKSTQLHIARAVADVLSAPQATNKFYHSDLIAEIVNFVGGINDNNHLTGKIIAKAFAGDCSDDYWWRQLVLQGLLREGSTAILQNIS